MVSLIQQQTGCSDPLARKSARRGKGTVYGFSGNEQPVLTDAQLGQIESAIPLGEEALKLPPAFMNSRLDRTLGQAEEPSDLCIVQLADIPEHHRFGEGVGHEIEGVEKIHPTPGQHTGAVPAGHEIKIKAWFH